MDSLQEAKRRLEKPGIGFVLVSGEYVFESEERGIAPPMYCLSNARDKMLGATVADKVIGRAVALLLILGGVKLVHAKTISQHAMVAFAKSNVSVTFDEMVPYIVNRKGDGMCPMEEAVLDIDDGQEAFLVLQKKIELMRISKNQK